MGTQGGNMNKRLQYTPEAVIAQGRATSVQSAKRLLEIERLERVNDQLVEAVRELTGIFQHGAAR